MPPFYAIIYRNNVVMCPALYKFYSYCQICDILFLIFISGISSYRLHRALCLVSAALDVVCSKHSADYLP